MQAGRAPVQTQAREEEEVDPHDAGAGAGAAAREQAGVGMVLKQVPARLGVGSLWAGAEGSEVCGPQTSFFLCAGGGARGPVLTRCRTASWGGVQSQGTAAPPPGALLRVPVPLLLDSLNYFTLALALSRRGPWL